RERSSLRAPVIHKTFSKIHRSGRTFTRGESGHPRQNERARTRPSVPRPNTVIITIARNLICHDRHGAVSRPLPENDPTNRLGGELLGVMLGRRSVRGFE